jgi:hypothetical protein
MILNWRHPQVKKRGGGLLDLRYLKAIKGRVNQAISRMLTMSMMLSGPMTRRG